MSSLIQSMLDRLCERETERRCALIEAAVDDTVTEIYWHRDSPVAELTCKIEDGILHIYEPSFYVSPYGILHGSGPNRDLSRFV